MKKGGEAKPHVETPQIEIIVRSGAEELAVIAFFSAGATEWDVVVGVNDPSARDALTLALRTAASAVAEAAFRPLPTAFDEGGSYLPPF